MQFMPGTSRCDGQVELRLRHHKSSNKPRAGRVDHSAISRLGQIDLIDLSPQLKPQARGRPPSQESFVRLSIEASHARQDGAYMNAQVPL